MSRHSDESLTDDMTAAFIRGSLPLSALIDAHTNTGTPYPISGDAITTTTKTRTK